MVALWGGHLPGHALAFTSNQLSLNVRMFCLITSQFTPASVTDVQLSSVTTTLLALDPRSF
jgi:hypothetical protein